MSIVIGNDKIHPEDTDIWLEMIRDEYGDRLTKLSYNYIREWNIAEDVVHDVFITCYREYEQVDKIVSFKSIDIIGNIYNGPLILLPQSFFV